MNKARSWRRYLMPVLIAGCAIIPCLNQNVYAEDTVPVTAVSAETAAKAKDYFDVLVNITEALNGTKCEQIQRDLRAVNHPENRRKMDFDISSLSGAASQEISKQYESKIRDYQTANKNFLNVCKSDPAARLANADLNALFKKSVAKANLMAEKQKHDIALAEAEKAKYEAEKAKAKADADAKYNVDRYKQEAQAAKEEAQAAKHNALQAPKAPAATSPTVPSGVRCDECMFYCIDKCADEVKGFSVLETKRCQDNCEANCNRNCSR